MNAVFGARVRLFVVAIAAISLVATLATFVFGPALQRVPPRPTDAHTFGPIGHGAAIKLLFRMGLQVEYWRQPQLGSVAVPLLVVEPERELATLDGAPLSLSDVVSERRSAGRKTILVLPKWEIGPFGNLERSRKEALSVLEASGLSATILFAKRIAAEREVLSPDGPLGRFSIELPSPQRLKPDGGRSILADAEGSFVVSNEDRTVFVIADPDLLHNFNFDRADNGLFLLRLFLDEVGTDAIALDEVFHGSVVHKSIAEALGKWPGQLVLVHATALILVLAWMALRRVNRAPPAPPRAHGPRHAISVSAGVLATGASLPLLASTYVEALLRYLATRTMPNANADLASQAKMLDDLARPRSFEGATELATAARDGRATLESAQRAHAFARNLLTLTKATFKKGTRP